MEKLQKIVILGAGGFAREVLWIFREANKVKPRWDVLGFVDDDKTKHGTIVCDLPVLGGFEWFEGINRGDVQILCGIGSTQIKKRLADESRNAGLEFCTLIHPEAKMSQYVSVGHGSIITAGNIITTQVQLGDHVTVNLSCTVGHDCNIGDFCTIAPGVHLSGYSTIGEGADLGTGCVVLPGVKVGSWSKIGAGAVVVKDVPDGVTVVGVPARIVDAGSNR